MSDRMGNRSEEPAPELEDRILPWSQVKVISGLSRTTVWRLQKTGDFPASVQVSPNRVGWWQSELLEWKRSRTPRRLPAPRPLPPPDPAPPPSDDAERRLQGRQPAPARPRRRTPAPPPEQGVFDF